MSEKVFSEVPKKFFFFQKIVCSTFSQSGNGLSLTFLTKVNQLDLVGDGCLPPPPSYFCSEGPTTMEKFLHTHIYVYVCVCIYI